MNPASASSDGDGIHVLPLTGEFDLANSGVLEANIAAALERDRLVIIDLSLAECIDSTG